MLKSTLDPQAIVKSDKATLSSFGNFMSDNFDIISSPTVLAKNKIINFNKKNLISTLNNAENNNLISNISTNILTSVEKSVKNVSNFNQNNIKSEIDSLRNEFYAKIYELSNDYESVKNQVSLNSLKINDIVKTVDNNNYESLKSEVLNIINELKSKSDKSNLELQNRINTIQVEMNSIIDSTSSTAQPKSFTTQLQDLVGNIRNQVDGLLENTLRNFSQDYSQKIKGFDDIRPNNVLSKFTDLYKNAIGFITYFGNDKNIKVVQDNLKFLRKMFEESFEVAKVLRQTIVKIVKQLSNLPNASPNSGGLNLDIAVPGGKLKQSAGPSVRNVGRGAKIGAALGVGALGLGGLASAASGMQSAKEFQEEKLAESGVSPASGGEYIPENIVDNFSSIVERFTAAVDNLIEGIKKSSSSGRGEGGGSSSPSSSPSSSAPSSPGGASGEIVSGGNSDFWTLAAISSLESPTAQGRADVAQSIYNRLASGIYTGNSIKELIVSRDGGEYQPVGRAAKEFRNINDRESAVVAVMTANKLSRSQAEKFIDDTASAIRNKNLQESAAKFVGGRTDFWATNLTPPSNGVGYAVRDGHRFGWFVGPGAISYGRKNPGPAKVPFLGEFEVHGKAGQTMGTVDSSQPTTQTSPQATPRPTQSTVAPAPARAQQIQARAQAIATPAQQTPTTVSLPPTVINATQPAAPEPQGGGLPPPSPPSGGSIEVPFLPTTNPDNFLTMYSRIVYNIVDG